VLEQVLGKLSMMHVSKNVKKNAMPFNLALPQIDPKTVSAQQSADQQYDAHYFDSTMNCPARRALLRYGAC
jgi:hypothetical protein